MRSTSSEVCCCWRQGTARFGRRSGVLSRTWRRPRPVIACGQRPWHFLHYRTAHATRPLLVRCGRVAPVLLPVVGPPRGSSHRGSGGLEPRGVASITSVWAELHNVSRGQKKFRYLGWLKLLFHIFSRTLLK